MTNVWIGDKGSIVKWLQNQNPIYAVYKTPLLKTMDTYKLKVKGWKRIFHANGNQKKAGVAIIISD